MATLATPHEELLARFDERRVLVLGDMVADEYLVGRPARISREAPVLVLHYAEHFVRPGGATNAAYNMRTLGARTGVVGVVGDDEIGRHLRHTLDDLSISTDGLIVDPGRPTSTKTRVLAKGTQEIQQQIVRIDRVDTTTLEPPLRARMIDRLRAGLQDVDTLLISDYENGVICQEVIDACLAETRRQGVTVTVDSHGDLFRFKGVTAATPNHPEVEHMLRTAIRDEVELERAGRALLHGMEAHGVLITLGEEGMALFERNQPTYRLSISPADASDIVDPTGAGDTVASVFTLAIASGAPMRVAAFLSNVAGGIVVRKRGAETLSRAELSDALTHRPAIAEG